MPAMAVSWSFTLLLVIAVVVLVTFTQPLFQSTPEMRRLREELKIAPQQNLPTLKAQGSMTLESQQQLSTQKTIQESKDNNERLEDICNRQGTRKTLIFQLNTFSAIRRTITEAHPPAARLEEDMDRHHAKDHGRSISAHFESDRMVPSGPNPLHNNNRSQIFFP